MAKKAEPNDAASGGVSFYICPIGSEGTPERKRADDVFKFVVSPAAEACELKPLRADKIGGVGEHPPPAPATGIFEELIESVRGEPLLSEDTEANHATTGPNKH